MTADSSNQWHLRFTVIMKFQVVSDNFEIESMDRSLTWKVVKQVSCFTDFLSHASSSLVCAGRDYKALKKNSLASICLSVGLL